MGKYQGDWVIMIGFKGEDLKTIAPIVEEFKEMYPDQGYNIGNSVFDAYDHILFCFADSRDNAHRIGSALVHKHLPQGHLYWVKEKNLGKYNIEDYEEKVSG